jgi:hypothetical protein
VKWIWVWVSLYKLGWVCSNKRKWMRFRESAKSFGYDSVQQTIHYSQYSILSTQLKHQLQFSIFNQIVSILNISFILFLSLHISTRVFMNIFSECEWVCVFSHSHNSNTTNHFNVGGERVDISNQQSTHIIWLLSWVELSWECCTILSLFQFNSIQFTLYSFLNSQYSSSIISTHQLIHWFIIKRFELNESTLNYSLLSVSFLHIHTFLIVWRIIGDVSLAKKMEEASQLIKRDIVFVASLYVWYFPS